MWEPQEDFVRSGTAFRGPVSTPAAVMSLEIAANAFENPGGTRRLLRPLAPGAVREPSGERYSAARLAVMSGAVVGAVVPIGPGSIVIATAW